MKKGKPTPPSKLVLFTLSALVLGLLLGRFLPLPLVQVPNTYKCPLDLPRYFNDPTEHEEIIQLLGFDHPQLLEGIYYEEIFWHSLILECSIVNGEAYIALVYPYNTYNAAPLEFRLQIVHFANNHPILNSYEMSFPTFAFDGIHFSDENNHYSDARILADHNQNGLLDATLTAYTGGSRGLWQVWMLEIYSDGSALNLIPDGVASNWSFKDVNGDGLLDWQATDLNSYMANYSLPMNIERILSWNGSAYRITSLQVDSVDSITATSILREYGASPQAICAAIQAGAPNLQYSDGSTNDVARNFFSILYYYDYMGERETAWEMIQPLLDEAANCPYDPSLIGFLEDMAKVHQYFEEE